MIDGTQDRVRREVEELHEFFVGWFTGALDQDAFESTFLPRFPPTVVFIPPAGKLQGFDDLRSLIHAGYAANPDFRIRIRNVQVRHEFEDYVLATYEEWQRNALASSPPDNGRIATVLLCFRAGALPQWHHIHETWLPNDIIAAGPYDF